MTVKVTGTTTSLWPRKSAAGGANDYHDVLDRPVNGVRLRLAEGRLAGGCHERRLRVWHDGLLWESLLWMECFLTYNVLADSEITEAL